MIHLSQSVRRIILTTGLVFGLLSTAAHAQQIFRICDNFGCRDVDPNSPPAARETETSQLAQTEGYRGEPLAELEKLARSGDNIAAYKVGTVYEEGLAGQAADLDKALVYYELGAEAGDPVSARKAAILLLANNFTSGPDRDLPPKVLADDDDGSGPASTPETVPTTYQTTPDGSSRISNEAGQKIIRYLYTAAEGQDAIGLLELGKLLYSGNLLSKSITDAALLFERAAELGSSDAQYFLGQMHFRGEGRPLNGYEAIKWTRQAASNGSILGQRALGQLYINGYETIAPDPIEAERWLFAAGQNGDVQSAQLLSLLRSGQYLPGGDYSVLLSAGDIVKASGAAMLGIQEIRRKLATAQDTGVVAPISQTVPWQPGHGQSQSPGQTTVAPSPRRPNASNGDCYIVEHVSYIEGKTVSREEEVCEAADGSFQVVA